MLRTVFAVMVGLFCSLTLTESASAQQNFGQQWGATAGNQDWQRFYHYPYITYPHNYYSPEYFRSAPDLYHRYPPELQIPAYNKDWINFFPMPQRYHYGNHFRLDIF
ncbi:MAG: hypothetical protein LBH00_07125 [Planctomycetaceae bacterium]|jgi:hypothetical protein|nr:hypothetical protein [Planctomycetaceae bacterium]